jgi:branched-chain amino acid transport system permease protein
MAKRQTAYTPINIRKFAKPIFWVGLVIILAILPLFTSSSYILHVLIMSLIYIIVAASFRTINISGQFALAHMGFMGIGAYLAGMAAKFLGWSPWICIPLAALAAGGIGMLIGYPFSRLRTLYYALGSLFFGLAIYYLILAFRTYTGGVYGLLGIPSLFPTLSKIPYYYFFLGLAVFSLLALYRFEFSRIGIDLKAIAQSPMAASSVGINEGFYRVLVLAVGCFFAGLAGAASAFYTTLLSYNTYSLGATLWIVTYAIVGGIGSFIGPIIGTAILLNIPEVFHSLRLYTPYISAGLLIIIIFTMPNGLVGLPQLIRSQLAKLRK